MSKFTYTAEEIRVLKNFDEINHNMIIHPDGFKVINGTKRSVVGYYNFETPYDYKEFGIFDVREFLTVLGMETHTLEVKDQYVEIEDLRTGATVKYNLTPLEMMPEVKDVHEKFEKLSINLEFSLSNENLVKIKKATNILKAERIYFESRDDTIRIICAGSVLTNSINPYEVPIKDEDIKQNDLDGILFISVDEFLLLEGDYHVKLSEKGISQWYNEGIKVEYFVGVTKYEE